MDISLMDKPSIDVSMCESGFNLIRSGVLLDRLQSISIILAYYLLITIFSYVLIQEKWYFWDNKTFFF